MLVACGRVLRVHAIVSHGGRGVSALHRGAETLSFCSCGSEPFGLFADEIVVCAQCADAW